MPNIRNVAARPCDLPPLRVVRRTAANDHRIYRVMKRTALRTMTVVAVLAAVNGCKTAPQLAWWKHEKPPEDSSAVARSAAPALPSAQSTPQAIAMAGSTPGSVSPTSPNLAIAAKPGATATAGAPLVAAAGAPPVSIPVTSPATIANAPTATYPAAVDTLADRLVSTPNTKSAAVSPPSVTPGAPLVGATASPKVAAAPAAVPAAGPYDPNGYKPSTALAASSADPSGAGADADRYGMSSSSPVAAAAVAPTSLALASDPANRYGSAAPAAPPAAMPGTSPLMDPAAVAADRYSNPNLPSLADKSKQVATTPAPIVPTTPVATTPPVPAPTTNTVASAPGQFRPGRTSSYTSAAATSPLEIASRPASPVTPTAPVPGSVSQPWTPPVSPTPTTRTY